MKDKFTFEMSFYFSGANEEWLPYGTTDFQFYIEHIEPYFLKVLSVNNLPIFDKYDLRRWVRDNTKPEINYVRDCCECTGLFTCYPNIEKLSTLGSKYKEETSLTPFNPISNTEILYETILFFDKKLGFEVCLFVQLQTLEINNVTA